MPVARALGISEGTPVAISIRWLYGAQSLNCASRYIGSGQQLTTIRNPDSAAGRRLPACRYLRFRVCFPAVFLRLMKRMFVCGRIPRERECLICRTYLAERKTISIVFRRLEGKISRLFLLPYFWYSKCIILSGDSGPPRRTDGRQCRNYENIIPRGGRGGDRFLYLY